MNEFTSEALWIWSLLMSRFLLFDSILLTYIKFILLSVLISCIFPGMHQSQEMIISNRLTKLFIVFFMFIDTVMIHSLPLYWVHLWQRVYSLMLYFHTAWNLCNLSGTFNPFTFSLITYIFGFKSTVWIFIFSLFSLFLIFYFSLCFSA